MTEFHEIYLQLGDALESLAGVMKVCRRVREYQDTLDGKMKWSSKAVEAERLRVDLYRERERLKKSLGLEP